MIILDDTSSNIVMSTAGEIINLGLPPVYKFPLEKTKDVVLKRRNDSKTAATNGFFIEDEEDEVGRGVSSESSSIGPASWESSSIGENSSSEAGEKEGEGEEEEEVQSKEKKEGLGSLESLEDSLPLKRGLSNFYAGKSKSFASLAESGRSSGAKGLAKPENPFNKRRRILAAWSRRVSCSSLVTSSSSLPPLFALDHTLAEEDDKEEEEELDESGNNCKHKVTATLPRSGTQRGMMMRKSFRSPRSFSLSDLQHTN